MKKTEHTRMIAAFALAILEDEGWRQHVAHGGNNLKGPHCLWGVIHLVLDSSRLEPWVHDLTDNIAEVVNDGTGRGVRWNDDPDRTFDAVRNAIIRYVEKG